MLHATCIYDVFLLSIFLSPSKVKRSPGLAFFVLRGYM